jgi:chromosome segregation ATPase
VPLAARAYRTSRANEREEEVNRDAIGALRGRAASLQQTLQRSIAERDRYQGVVNAHQREIDNAVTEINSINAAIALLEEAITYASEQNKEVIDG